MPHAWAWTGPVPLCAQEHAGLNTQDKRTRLLPQPQAMVPAPPQDRLLPTLLLLLCFTNGLLLAVSATLLSSARCGHCPSATTDLSGVGAPCWWGPGLGHSEGVPISSCQVKGGRAPVTLWEADPPGWPLLLLPHWTALVSILASCPHPPWPNREQSPDLAVSEEALGWEAVPRAVSTCGGPFRPPAPAPPCGSAFPAEVGQARALICRELRSSFPNTLARAVPTQCCSPSSLPLSTTPRPLSEKPSQLPSQGLGGGPSTGLCEFRLLGSGPGTPWSYPTTLLGRRCACGAWCRSF